jgi:hypothetical protein
MLANRKLQCAADTMTNRGEMVMYYGWKKVGDNFYLEGTLVPVVD